MADSYFLLQVAVRDTIANPPRKFRLSIPLGLMPWYELETRIKLMRFTLPRLFNIAHFQNQRKTVVLCMNALQTRAGGRQVNGWKGFGNVKMCSRCSFSMESMLLCIGVERLPGNEEPVYKITGSVTRAHGPECSQISHKILSFFCGK